MAYAVLVEKTVPMARSAFFAALMDLGGIARQAPDFIESCVVEGEGIGAVRRFRLKGGGDEVLERLDCAFDQRVFSYSVVSDNSLGLDHYHAVVILSDAPGGGCHVAWGSNWTSRITPAAEVRETLAGLYATLIDAIVKG